MTVRWAGLLGVAALLALLAGRTQAEVTEAQVKRSLEQAYNVTVLRIRQVDHEGQPAFVVTMMNPGGNFNEAFQVNTVLVDADSGKLISQFRHRTSGYDPNAAPRYAPNRHSADALETGMIWR